MHAKCKRLIIKAIIIIHASQARRSTKHENTNTTVVSQTFAPYKSKTRTRLLQPTPTRNSYCECRACEFCCGHTTYNTYALSFVVPSCYDLSVLLRNTLFAALMEPIKIVRFVRIHCEHKYRITFISVQFSIDIIVRLCYCSPTTERSKMVFE